MCGGQGSSRTVEPWRRRNQVLSSTTCSLPCATQHNPMKAYWGRRGIAPCIIDLCSIWR